MKLPAPFPGLVIRYAYLWKREYETGQEKGSKDRPCAIVMRVVTRQDEQQVLVLPITHTPPHDPAATIEIPPDTKRRLGLDAARSWVVISEPTNSSGQALICAQPKDAICRPSRLEFSHRASLTIFANNFWHGIDGKNPCA